MLQHHKSDDYPGDATTHRRGGRKDGDEAAAIADAAATHERVKRSSTRSITRFLRRAIKPLADNKRAAYEVLNGPVDWDALN